jgi:hypothetical protein
MTRTTKSTPVPGGKATVSFNVTAPGNYIVKARVQAANTGQNSVYLNFDNEPQVTQLWDITPTGTAFADRTATWRGAGTFDSPQFNPKVFYLSVGSHTLIIRGREPYTQIDKVNLVKQ